MHFALYTKYECQGLNSEVTTQQVGGVPVGGVSRDRGQQLSFICPFTYDIK